MTGQPTASYARSLRLFTGSTFLVLVGCVLAFSVGLSWYLVTVEKNRLRSYERQVEGAFELEHQRLAEETYYGNYESVALRVQHIARSIGDGSFEVLLRDGSGRCLLHVSHAGPLGCPSSAMEAHPEAMRSVLPTLEFDSASSRYRYEAGLTSSGQRIGQIQAWLGDPYQFYRQSTVLLAVRVFLVTCVPMLLILSVWLWFSNRKFLRPTLKSIVEGERNRAAATALYDHSRKLIHDLKPIAHNLAVTLENYTKVPEELRRNLRSIQSTLLNMTTGLGERYRNPQGPNETAYTLVGESLRTAVGQSHSLVEEGENVEIRLDLPTELMAVVVRMTSTDLESRVLSNVIRNAVEAIRAKGQHGTVRVRGQLKQGTVVVEVEDDGVGMEPALLRKVLTEGGSFHKKSGSGLGLTIVREFVSRAGGQLEMFSEQGKGTTVRLSIPAAPLPSWLTLYPALDPGRKIVVLDDCEANRERISEILQRFGVVALGDPEEFSAELYPPRSHQYLFDYDLKAGAITGLDLIVRDGLHRDAYLITTYYNDPFVQKKAAKAGVKIFPRFLIETLAQRPEGTPPARAPEKKQRPDVVLIDDSDIKRLTFEQYYARYGRTCLSVWGWREFEALNVPHDTPVLVDYQDGEGIEIARRLHDCGYVSLYLASSHPRADEEWRRYPFLKGLIDEPRPLAEWHFPAPSPQAPQRPFR